jgi:hypothetical protein
VSADADATSLFAESPSPPGLPQTPHGRPAGEHANDRAAELTDERAVVLDMPRALTEAEATAAGPAAWSGWRTPLINDLVERADEQSGERADKLTDERAEPTASVRGRTISWPGGVLHPPTSVGIAWVAAGVGLLAYGLAVAWAPAHFDLGLKLFWFSQLMPFAVFTCLLVMVPLTLRERVVVVSLVGVLPSIAYRSRDLMQFTGFDELLHERTLHDLAGGSGLFAANPLLSISPYYPGLESLTGLLMRLTGAPAQPAALVVVVGCRLLLMLGIFAGALGFTRSDFRASLVVLFYACCPQFFSFNSQFAYQTLALTLGLGALLLLRQAQQATEVIARRQLLVAAIVSLAATIVTHHATSWLVLAFLWLWVVGTRGADRRVLVWGGLAGIGLLAAWSGAVFSRLVEYFGPVVVGSFQGLISSLGGSSQRQLFADTSGSQTPMLERAALIVYALICTATALAAGVILLRDAWRSRNLATGILGVLALAYPATLAGRFAPAASEVGDRASTFLFLPLALAAAAVVEMYVFTRPVRLRSSKVPPIAVVGITTAIVVAYFGGILLGSGADWSRLPGPYLVEADYRSADAENRAAVQWAGDALPAGSRIVADRYPAAMLSGETRLFPMIEPEHGLEPASLYFSLAWGAGQTRIVRGLGIRYLYVDSRLSQDLPRFGAYFSARETPTLERLSTAALNKFASVPGLTAVYRHGPITIYDTKGIGGVPAPSGWSGPRRNLPVAVDLGLGALLGLGVILLLRVRSRRARIAAFARAADPVGTAVVSLSALLFVGLAVFGLRIVPSPLVLVAGAVMSLSFCADQARPQLAAAWRRRRLVPLDLYVLLGSALAVAGLVTAFESARQHQVTDVQRVLSEAFTIGGHR